MISNFGVKEFLGPFPSRTLTSHQVTELGDVRSLVFRLQVVSDNYYRFLSKKKALEVTPEEPGKLSARDAFGIVMISHGEEFGEDSAFGAPFHSFVR